MFRKYAAAASAGLLLVAGQASAAGASASLDSIRGQVMVNQGAGYTAGAGASLKAGDRVLAMSDGSARVRYADGCVISLAPKAMATIGAQSPCAADGLVRGSAPAQMDWFGSQTFWIIAGIALLAVVIVAADDDDDPVSP